jgi:hypothetical protein
MDIRWKIGKAIYNKTGTDQTISLGGTTKLAQISKY